MVYLLMDNIGIYKIINTANSKFYVGSSKKIEARFKQHRWHLTKGTHHSRILQNSWNKYGEDVFAFEVLELCAVEELEAREQYYLNDLQPRLNVLPKARSFSGHKWTEEAKKKSSESRKGKLSTEKAREIGAKGLANRSYVYGWTASEDTKRRMSKAHQKRVTATSLVDDCNLEFESVRLAAEFINKSVPTMSRYLRKEKEYMNYKWRFTCG